MSTRSDRPAAATRCLARRCCSADSVIEWTCAPRAAALQAQFAPAGADLQYPAARADARGVQQAVDLASLRVGQVGRRGRQRVEQRARIRHRFVEELGEQIVGQVVVLGDVAARLGSALVVRTRMADRRKRPKPLQRRRDQLGQPLRELGEHTSEV